MIYITGTFGCVDSLSLERIRKAIRNSVDPGIYAVTSADHSAIQKFLPTSPPPGGAFANDKELNIFCEDSKKFVDDAELCIKSFCDGIDVSIYVEPMKLVPEIETFGDWDPDGGRFGIFPGYSLLKPGGVKFPPKYGPNGCSSWFLRSLGVGALFGGAMAHDPKFAVKLLTYGAGGTAGTVGYVSARIDGGNGSSMAAQASVFAVSAISVASYGALIYYRWLPHEERLQFLFGWIGLSIGANMWLNSGSNSAFSADGSKWPSSLPLISALGALIAHLVLIVLRNRNSPSQHVETFQMQNVVELQVV